MKRGNKIPKRRRIYIGCEGQSEVSYIALIRDIAEELGLPLALQPDDLASGDPLSRVEEAIRRIKKKEAAREAFAEKFLFLDDDQASLDLSRAERAIILAKKNGIKIVWQRTCHEAMLLRHFKGYENHRPQDTRLAEQALKRVWPEYAKPMDKRDLSRRISHNELKRVAMVEGELKEFLMVIGILTD